MRSLLRGKLLVQKNLNHERPHDVHYFTSYSQQLFPMRTIFIVCVLCGLTCACTKEQASIAPVLSKDVLEKWSVRHWECIRTGNRAGSSIITLSPIRTDLPQNEATIYSSVDSIQQVKTISLDTLLIATIPHDTTQDVHILQNVYRQGKIDSSILFKTTREVYDIAYDPSRTMLGFLQGSMNPRKVHGRWLLPDVKLMLYYEKRDTFTELATYDAICPDMNLLSPANYPTQIVWGDDGSCFYVCNSSYEVVEYDIATKKQRVVGKGMYPLMVNPGRMLVMNDKPWRISAISLDTGHVTDIQVIDGIQAMGHSYVTPDGTTLAITYVPEGMKMPGPWVLRTLFWNVSENTILGIVPYGTNGMLSSKKARP